MKRYSFMNYFEYLRDNPKEYWFKRKLYGWGWAPAKWQGWITTLVFLIIIIFDGLYFNSKVGPGQPSSIDFVLFFGILIIAIITLISICYKKGEKPHWTWGR